MILGFPAGMGGAVCLNVTGLRSLVMVSSMSVSFPGLEYMTFTT